MKGPDAGRVGRFNPRRAARSRALESDRALNAPPGVRGRVSARALLSGGGGDLRKGGGHLRKRDGARGGRVRACACERGMERRYTSRAIIAAPPPSLPPPPGRRYISVA